MNNIFASFFLSGEVLQIDFLPRFLLNIILNYSLFIGPSSVFFSNMPPYIINDRYYNFLLHFMSKKQIQLNFGIKKNIPGSFSTNALQYSALCSPTKSV